MNIITIVNLLGTIITIEEGGRGFLSLLRQKMGKKKLRIRWDSSDPTVQRFIDSFKASPLSEYKEHIFSPKEIQIIADGFIKQKAYLGLSRHDIANIKKGIDVIFSKYNKFTQKQMTLGERVLLDKIEEKDVIKELEDKQHTDNMNRFLQAVDYSKTIGLTNIESFINGEYEIDRSSIIEKIHSRDSRFISIIGPAGSGKSVIAKKLVEKEKYVLYTRADSLVNKNDISEIWNCELPDAVLNLEGKCFIFLDAMEFIADCKSDRWILVQKLYNFAEKHTNVYIISTCRSEDQNALLLKLQKYYSIESFEIDDVSAEELAAISEKYPIISELEKQPAYSDLLKSPFYINLIVSKLPNDLNIQDESMLRQEIWSRVICLSDKAKEYGLSSDEIRDAVEKITFNRAKRFELGVHQTEIKDEILRVLISEGVVAWKEELIRLKYDIYEDICFENLIDMAFDSCKGNYSLFFDEIANLGRCIYRRYQIWISNKLFLKRNRERFIYNLIKGESIPGKWNEQTEIGIVKSKYCSSFFQEYFEELLKSNRLEEIIKIVNLYAFEACITNDTGNNSAILRTNPIGNARSELITLIDRNWGEVTGKISNNNIVRLCEDYAKQSSKDQAVSVAACNIIQRYINSYLKEKPGEGFYRAEQEIISLLLILYQMADVCCEWIKGFWELLQQGIQSTDDYDKKWAIETVRETLRNVSLPLVYTLSKELCQLANDLWINQGEVSNELTPFEGIDDQRLSVYGLSKEANDYYFRERSIESNPFLWGLFSIRFNIGFQWAIDFVNHAMECFAKNNSKEIEKVELFFCDKTKKEYWATESMWMIGVEEQHCPMLIGDIIYTLKKVIIHKIRKKIDAGKMSETLQYAEMIKREIYYKSNNIALLSIVEAIGMNFQHELLGYAIELASCMPLIYMDYRRFGLFAKNPTKELLEHKILQSFGIPSLEKRYELDRNCNMNLQGYMISQQLFAESMGKKEILQKCYQILDYLYSTTVNKGYEAHNYLQIQKMDSRNAQLTKIDENIYSIEPVLTGAAKKIVEQTEETKKSSPAGRIDQAIQNNIQTLFDENRKPNLQVINRTLDVIIDGINDDEYAEIKYQNTMVQLMALALSDINLEQNRREKYCQIWIDGLNEYFNNGSFASDNKLLPVLFQQLEATMEAETKNRIKRLMLNSILCSGTNGIITQMAESVKIYLIKKQSLAKCIFNTIIVLAEDEMNHQIYNAKYAASCARKGEFTFIPNGQPRLTGIDHRITQNGGKLFKSEKEEIIEKHLFREEPIEIDCADIDRYDIRTLCFAANCGLSLNDGLFMKIMRNLLHRMIELWHLKKGNVSVHDIIGFDGILEVAHFFRQELLQEKTASKAIDLLFDDMPFERFTSETIKFYSDIYNRLGLIYFNAYNDNKRRENIEEIIHYTEMKIITIQEEKVKIELYKTLIFALSQYMHGDWQAANADYSYRDKMFLNDQFAKYGKYHIKDLIFTIYMFHIDKLMPEILNSLCISFEEAAKNNLDQFQNDVQEMMGYVDLIILTAFITFSDEIKKDDVLSQAYECILSLLIQMNNSKAAIILDEFRIH